MPLIPLPSSRPYLPVWFAAIAPRRTNYRRTSWSGVISARTPGDRDHGKSSPGIFFATFRRSRQDLDPGVLVRVDVLLYVANGFGLVAI